jgi:hypothetical protein
VFEDVFNYRLIVVFLTLQLNWWVVVNGAIVGDGKYLSTGGQAMVGLTPEGVPSRQTIPSCPGMPIRLDGWTLVCACLPSLSFTVITITQLLQW